MLTGLDKPPKAWYNKSGKKNADEKTSRALRCGCGKIIAYIRDGDIYIKCRGCGHELKLNNIEP